MLFIRKDHYDYYKRVIYDVDWHTQLTILHFNDGRKHLVAEYINNPHTSTFDNINSKRQRYFHVMVAINNPTREELRDKVIALLDFAKLGQSTL